MKIGALKSQRVRPWTKGKSGLQSPLVMARWVAGEEVLAHIEIGNRVALTRVATNQVYTETDRHAGEQRKNCKRICVPLKRRT